MRAQQRETRGPVQPSTPKETAAECIAGVCSQMMSEFLRRCRLLDDASTLRSTFALRYSDFPPADGPLGSFS
jgi:hypothetical protein